MAVLADGGTPQEAFHAADGVVDEGDCPGAGPPPFQDVDTNGDGKIDREEARAMFGQDEDGNPDPEFDSRFDSRAGDDGFVDQAEYNQADQDGGQPPECDVCGYQFTGPEDHHVVTVISAIMFILAIIMTAMVTVMYVTSP